MAEGREFKTLDKIPELKSAVSKAIEAALRDQNKSKLTTSDCTFKYEDILSGLLYEGQFPLEEHKIVNKSNTEFQSALKMDQTKHKSTDRKSKTSANAQVSGQLISPKAEGKVNIDGGVTTTSKVERSYSIQKTPPKVPAGHSYDLSIKEIHTVVPCKISAPADLEIVVTIDKGKYLRWGVYGGGGVGMVAGVVLVVSAATIPLHFGVIIGGGALIVVAVVAVGAGLGYWNTETFTITFRDIFKELRGSREEGGRVYAVVSIKGYHLAATEKILPLAQGTHQDEQTAQGSHRDEQTAQGSHRDEQTAQGPHRDEQTAQGPRQDEQTTQGTHQDEQTAQGSHRDEQTAQGPHQDEQTTQGTHQDEQTAQGPHQDEQTTQGTHQDEQTAQGSHRDEQTAQGPHQDEQTTQGTHQDEQTAQGPHQDEQTAQGPHQDEQTAQKTPHEDHTTQRQEQKERVIPHQQQDGHSKSDEGVRQMTTTKSDQKPLSTTDHWSTELFNSHSTYVTLVS